MIILHIDFAWLVHAVFFAVFTTLGLQLLLLIDIGNVAQGGSVSAPWLKSRAQPALAVPGLSLEGRKEYEPSVTPAFIFLSLIVTPGYLFLY